jgi:hypothetical protein
MSCPQRIEERGCELPRQQMMMRMMGGRGMMNK